MGVHTRSSASSSPVKLEVPTKVALPYAEGEPYSTFILPSNTSSDARFVLLQHPRDGARRRFYFCPSKGIYEVTKISANMHDLRSILFTPDRDVTTLQAGKVEDELHETTIIEKEVASSGIASTAENSPCQGYVNKTAEIFVATPFDPVFILLPLLDQSATSSRIQPGDGLFRPFDDILDEHQGDDRHLRHVLNNPTFRPTLLTAMSHVCDTVDAGDEHMYRLSMLKLYNFIFSKARKAVENGLPASMEERFVTRSLEVPMLGVKRVESGVSCSTKETDAAVERLVPDMSESQSSIASLSTSASISEISSISSATSIGTVDHAPSEGLRYLQRLRTAMSFITTSYLNPILSTKLAEMSRDGKALPDFAPLDEHLQHVAKLRAEALATRSLSDFSKKRNFDEDGEAAEERADKKRKQEEDDKKKKSQESRGVRDLKKVNVSGMKKMSDFFAKKGPTATSKA
ncbi:hypothetical protein EPUS_00024 [Endocarpon pusillum Z07020]|uniref:Ribonuclease H2 subunit B n=1 Tax=Endocarpon pusillum (strain Z07020 / HMAS-L-300199) TaxID=1263415 RepID=U1GCC7_ENDPU|nr:uncharacterized protein EPUS_00024 [Endocarpon pusillum Z07020]ERF75232.1 hypothetical protein EPUS_00024 [Endocarpon pusillum Z07020]